MKTKKHYLLLGSIALASAIALTGGAACKNDNGGGKNSVSENTSVSTPEESAEKLSTPENARIDEDAYQYILRWDAIKNSNGYTVKVGNETLETDQTQIDLTNQFTITTEDTAPSYKVSVKANGDGSNFSDSEWSEFTHTMPAYTKELQFTLLPDDTYEVSWDWHRYVLKTIIFPDYHNGKPVTSIGKRDFSNSPFDQRLFMEKIRLPVTLKTIKSDGLSQGKLKKLFLPDSVETLETAAFGANTLLEKVIFSKNLKTIGMNAFCDTALTNATFPEGLKYIGASAFLRCSKLKTIDFPKSLEDVGKNAFLNTAWLTSNIALYVTINNMLYTYKGVYEDSLLDLNTLPSRITKICSGAFKEQKNITKIILPSPKKCVLTGEGIFTKCQNLEEVVFPDDLEIIPASIFQTCIKLNNIALPDGIKEIGDNAFSGCRSLIKINLPDGIKKIGDNAFTGCSSLTEINLPDEIKEIGEYAFANCSSLTEINLPDGIEKIGNSAFHSTLITEIVIPNSLQVFEGAFRRCKSLTSVQFPDALTAIPNAAFQHCSALTEIQIPETVTKIGDDAFSYTAISHIILPEGLTALGERAFYVCKNLLSIKLPNGITSIPNGLFSNCSNLETVICSDDVTYIGDKAFSACYALKNFRIPSAVTHIGESAFSSCKSLTGLLELPDNLQEIGVSAFRYCTGLTGISFSRDVSENPSLIFDSCTNLTDVIFKEGVTKLIHNAIYPDSVKNVFIPKSAKELCRIFDHVENIYYSGTATEWDALVAATASIYPSYQIPESTKIYFYSEENPYAESGNEEGNYWHYAPDGKSPVIWKKEEL